MSSRVFVRGAGTVCLITAALGFGLATDKSDDKTKAPPGPEEGGKKRDGRLLRTPLPTPGFGMTSPSGEPIPDSSFAVRTKRSELLGSASTSWAGTLPMATRPDLPALPIPPVETSVPELVATAPAATEAEAAPNLAVSDASAPEALPELPEPVASLAQISPVAPIIQAAPVELAIPDAVEPETSPGQSVDPVEPDPAPALGQVQAPDQPDSFATAFVAPTYDFTPIADTVDAARPAPLAPPPPPVEVATPAPALPPLDEAPNPEPVAEPAQPVAIPPAPAEPEPASAPDTPAARVAVEQAPEPQVAPEPAAAAQALAPSSQVAAEQTPVASLAQSATPPPAARVAPSGSSPVVLVPVPTRRSTLQLDTPRQPAAKDPAAAAPASSPPPPLAPVAQTDGMVESFAPGTVIRPASATPTAALVPAARKESTLGLPGNSPSGVLDANGATMNPTGAFGGAPGLAYTPAAGEPLITYQDELILEVRVDGFEETDTIIAYGTRSGLYLPLGTIARILDLAIVVGDEGRYAEGWILSEDRTAAIDVEAGTITIPGKTIPINRVLASNFDGEMYLRLDQFSALFPLEVKIDLRAQAVLIKTLEPFPFEERRAREARREKLAGRATGGARDDFERVDLPYEAFSIPTADVELRAISDSANGERVEGDVLLTGDLGYLSAEAYLSADTKYGLTAARFQVGRQDPDAELLGPLSATSFALGDVSTTSMQLGLRSISGRGITLTNAPSQQTSVFDKVDLRGILPDGYEVELYRNDILVGSTRDAVNGQYEFLQVPVDFGLNVFRLVFFGPQGQRSEVVQRISVGDGRVREGQLVYSLDAAQKGLNLLGVTPPNFVAPGDYGDWRVAGQLAYGLSSGLTTMLGGSWFQSEGEDRWIGTAGVRTSISGIAVKADFGVANGGAYAFGGGIASRFGRSAITLSHTEYSGLFPDETKSIGLSFLRRATELDFNTSFKLGDDITGLVVPLTARLRNYVDVDGRNTLLAGFRASTRLSGLLVSNTLDYSRSSGGDLEANTQLFGNFDLATLGRSKTNARVSLGYQLAPQTDLVNASFEINHALDDRTSLRASAGYLFSEHAPVFGISGVREFDKFTLALDGNYNFVDNSYFVGLRIGFGLGRDPLRHDLFVARPGVASSGGATLRAFRDRDGDGTYGPSDELLEGVTFATYNQTAKSGADGVARVNGLGAGRPVSVQLDPTSLPDLDLAPAKPGLEIVPRAGRLQPLDFAVVALSEVEGTARFEDASTGRGVSGVRLHLVDEKGKIVAYSKTELDGYFFFERVPPGQYRLRIDPEQVERLQLCPIEQEAVFVGYESSIVNRDIAIDSCATGLIARRQ